MAANRTYRKNIILTLETEAQNITEATQVLNKVAHSIHSNNHPLLIGGKNKAKVHMKHTSFNIAFVPKRSKTY